VKFILSNVKDNGAIGGGGETDRYPNCSTAIGTMALLATGRAGLTDTIKRGKEKGQPA